MDLDILLPPEFPEVRIWFIYDHPDFEQKFHRDCPGAGADAWHVEMCHSFSSVPTVIHNLTNEEETYWCHYCRRGLFSPTHVPIHYMQTSKYGKIACGSYPLFITDIHG